MASAIQQDFENTPPLQKLEKYLKRQVPLFWRNKAQFIGYQEGCVQNNAVRATMRIQKLGMLPQGQQPPQEELNANGQTSSELEPQYISGMSRKSVSDLQTAEDATNYQVRIGMLIMSEEWSHQCNIQNSLFSSQSIHYIEMILHYVLNMLADIISCKKIGCSVAKAVLSIIYWVF